MVDRISRSYVHYSAYRQPSSVKVSNSNFVEKQIHSTPTQSGRSIMAQSYMKKHMEYSLVHASEASNRIKDNYGAIGQARPVLELQDEGYPYMGLHVDIKA